MGLLCGSWTYYVLLGSQTRSHPLILTGVGASPRATPTPHHRCHMKQILRVQRDRAPLVCMPREVKPSPSPKTSYVICWRWHYSSLKWVDIYRSLFKYLQRVPALTNPKSEIYGRVTVAIIAQ